MKNLGIILMVAVLAIVSCNSGNKTNGESSYKYVEKKAALNSELEKRIGSWAEEGKECYGVVVFNGQEFETTGKTVKAKIVRIKADSLKMKALETVNLTETTGCSKLGIKYGDTWWEVEGDLFQTQEEAEQFLSDKGWAE